MKNSLLILCMFFFLSVFSQNESKRLLEFNLENKVAMHGYDPVSYFTKGMAVEGKKVLSVTYTGVIYYFSSKENKEIFLKNPAAYEPQYGGWCAYAMGNSGEKVEVDPETFKIIGGKLYLFYNAYFNNTLKKWNKNESVLNLMADKNWKMITTKK